MSITPNIRYNRGQGSGYRREDIFPEQFNLPSWTHPEVVYNFQDWRLIRDAAAGERQVKAEGPTYLPKFEGMDDSEYRTYLDSATFYNFTDRTIRALAGTLFRRDPVITNWPERWKKAHASITRSGTPLLLFQKQVAREIMTVGRYGVLLDLGQNETTEPLPYLAGYAAENILDWDVAVDETASESGMAPAALKLTKVVLREIKLIEKPSLLGPQPIIGEKAKARMKAKARQEALSRQSSTVNEPPGGGGTAPGMVKEAVARYRVLRLTRGEDGRWVYTQQLYESSTKSAELTAEYAQPVVTPLRRDEPLDFIPFQFFGPFQNTPAIEQSPVKDIAYLNMSHFRSYAHLEQGRFYTGFPTYFVEVGQGSEAGGEYTLGPNRVWEVTTGSKPGLLEFNGHGLLFLEHALDQKEQQAASLGGRMMGIRTQAVAESDNALKLKERNEQSLLLDAAQALDSAWTQLMRWWLWWAGATEAQMTTVVRFNKDFMFDGIGARELRAIQSMYMDGIIPIQVVYDYLRRADVIPDWLTAEEFQTLFESMTESFPGQPDAEARADGYPDKKTQLQYEKVSADEQAKLDAAEAAKAAAKAKPQPKLQLDDTTDPFGGSR